MVALPLALIVPAFAVKVPLVDMAGIVMDAGTVKVELFEARETVVLPLAAAFVNVTVQVLFAPEANVAGEHCTDDRLTGACSVTLAEEDAPFRVAVMVALAFDATVPAVAMKAAEVELAGTETEAGIARVPSFEDSETVVAPLAVELDSVTVQVLLAPEVNVEGEHCTDDRLTAACSTMLAVEDAPFRVAEMVALPLDAMVPAVAEKFAEVELAGTDTEAGTVRAPLFEDSATVVAPLAVELDSVTVQVLFAPEASVEGEQDREDKLTGACRAMLKVADPPFRPAVIVPVRFEVIVPAVAVKVADVEFAGTSA